MALGLGVWLGPAGAGDQHRSIQAPLSVQKIHGSSHLSRHQLMLGGFLALSWRAQPFHG